jgi:small subunit ribosomal protein S2
MSSDLVRQLLEAGVHFGHQTKRWNPKMKRFIFGSRSGIYIIDLEKTEEHLKQARDFLEDLAARGQQVIFVGTKKQAKPILEAEAKRARMPYVVNRWLGGTLTNFQTIKANIDRMRTLRKQRDDGFFERVSKKDAKQLTKELERLEEHFSGLADLEKLPGCLFVVDIKREDISVREANRLKIPIVAICDTNADPDLIMYPIPGNDDAIRSIRLITSLVSDSLVSGRQRYEVEHQPAIEPIARTEDEIAEAGVTTTQAVTDEPGDVKAKEDQH